VVIMTAYATIETAVEATRKGAYDYITKPFRRERILMTVEKAMAWQAVVQENHLARALADKQGFGALVGSSPAMQSIFERIRQVAPTMGTVLITGPSGTGKELVAQAIHQNSSRSDRKMVTINCTAIPENVLESELFGHVKGAFTGAWKDKKGLVEAAHESTLVPGRDRGFEPHAADQAVSGCCRKANTNPWAASAPAMRTCAFIAATNHDLREAIAEKRFREDLYYRLAVVHIDLPSLRERREDIPLLSHFFLAKYAKLNRKEITAISEEALQALVTQAYPGNVRELENTIERGVIFCNTHTLALKDLGLEHGQAAVPVGAPDPALLRLSFRDAKEKMIRRFHKEYLSTLLAESGGNVSRAAENAGIQRQYLHRLMKEEDIAAETFKE
jgi:DNA-binding NtrC family response regulator